MNIFVGNLNAKTTAHHLSDLFFRFGKVLSSKVIMDSGTGHSLGFGFIEMDKRSAMIAIDQLHHLNFMNSYLEVNEVAI
jgi:RNA recognition motif-containing protein